MNFTLWPVHRISPLRAPVASDEFEGQGANGGLSFRTNFGLLGLLPKAVVDVTALELINPDFNSKVLVPAQAGTVIIPQMIVFQGVFNTTPFDSVGTMNVGYGVSPAIGNTFPNVLLNTDSPDMAILQGSGDRYDIGALQSSDGSGFASQLVPAVTWKDASLLVNKDLTLWWDGTQYADGDAMLRVTCYYTLL